MVQQGNTGNQRRHTISHGHSRSSFSVKKRGGAVAGKVLYGALFVVLLPMVLLAWATFLDRAIDLPVPDWRPVAIGATVAGIFLLGKGVLDLWTEGRGLPMNAYPPEKFVTGGIYHWLSHPIYAGAGLLAAGSSLWAGSEGGLYVVTPVLCLGMVSLVYGYERAAILRVFGHAAASHRTVMSIPASGKSRRVVMGLIVFFLLSVYMGVISSLSGVPLTGNVFVPSAIVLAALAAAYWYPPVWNAFVSFGEWTANSRHDWLFFNGRFRIINHSIFSGLAGATATGFLLYVIGNGAAVLFLGCCAVIGAAAFAQFRWGSTSLLRPFGYWGAISGAMLAILLLGVFWGIPVYQSAVAGALGAPFAQAVGRLRCLSQGCCHGTVSGKGAGIRVWQSQSRVVVLSGLKGEYLLPTQLFSIMFNLGLGVLLLSLWGSGEFNASFIVGMYFVLTGIERFTEDAYRGEKQTKLAKGLKENQWIAIGATAAGMIVTMIPSPTVGAMGAFNPGFGIISVAGGLIAAFAMSMDFPKSRIRFSRLSG